MRVVLADLKSNRGFVSKDTVVGGYGSRLDPFSRVTTASWRTSSSSSTTCPSVHMAYIAAILARAGHDVTLDARRAGGWRRRAGAVVARRSQERNRVGRPDARARRQGRVRRHHGVEDARAVRRPLRLHPERRAGGGVMRLAQGEIARRDRRQRADRRSRFAAVSRAGIWSPRIAAKLGIQWSSRPVGGGFPLLASRGCPEFCTYCPHRILAGYRARSIAQHRRRARAALRSASAAVRRSSAIRCSREQRDRCLELCDEIRRAG